MTASTSFPSLGWDIYDWIVDNLVVPDGPDTGQPLVLTDEQLDLLVRFYRVDPKTGEAVYRRAAVTRPKGWGKSPFLAALALAEACGPVRFARWEDGEPKGEPPPTPWVQIAAVSEDQTDNTYRALLGMVAEGAPVVANHGLDVGITRINIPGGGLIEPVTSASGTREGQRVTFAVLDETHLWLVNNQGHKLAATIRRNVGKMDGRSFESTNAWVPGEQSVAELTAQAAEAGQRGVLFDRREPTGHISLRNKAELRRGVREAYGDAAGRWVNVERILEEIADPATTEDDARRFYLNQIVTLASQAFVPEEWAAQARPGVVIPNKELIVLGFDGSRFHDATALVATHVDTGFQWPLGIWEVPPNEPDYEIPEPEVEAVVEQAFDTYDVWRLYGDPPYWETAEDRWAGRWGEKRVVKWYTNRVTQMCMAVAAYSSAIRSGDLTHDGDSVFARHIANARKRETNVRDDTGRKLWGLRKEHPSSPLKIDGAVAGCISWEARRDAIAAGAKRKTGRAVFV